MITSESKSREEHIAKEWHNHALATSSNSAIISPGQWTLFDVLPGRNYVVVVTDIDDSYPANVQICQLNWGDCLPPFTVESNRAVTKTVKANDTGIRVYNHSSDSGHSGRPKIFVTIYAA